MCRPAHAWFLKLFLCGHLYVCLCVCLPQSVLITSDMIAMKSSSYDWFNRLYGFYIVAIVGIVSKCGLTIEVCHRNQPNKSRLAPCKPWIHFTSHLKLLYITNKMECFNYKGGCDMHGRKCIELLEELAWVRDKQLRIISNIML